MQQILLILTLIILSFVRAFGQDTIHINDDAQLSHCLSLIDSKMVDTATNTFKTAKQNVLKYCNSTYDFRVDTCAIYYSCREYFSSNKNASPKEFEIYKKEKLQYVFFITLKINPTLYYYLDFVLDTELNVKDASKICKKAGAKKIWGIKEWVTISEGIINYKNGFITPINENNFDLMWDKHKRIFVYEVEQEFNDKTEFIKKSDFVGYYEVNKLIIKASTGRIIKETTQKYMSTSFPSF